MNNFNDTIKNNSKLYKIQLYIAKYNVLHAWVVKNVKFVIISQYVS